MAWDWRSGDEEGAQADPTGGVFDGTSTARAIQNDMTFGEMRKRSPREFVKRVEKWCNRVNPESHGRSKNLSIIESLQCYQHVYDTVINTFPAGKEFATKQVIDLIDPHGISDGNRQRKILSYLVCLGVLKKVLIAKDMKGKLLKRPHYLFSVNEKRLVCPSLTTYTKKRGGGTCKGCGFDWKHSAHTSEYFQQLPEESGYIPEENED